MKTILFDVDGVLLDADEQYVEIYENVGKTLGLTSPGGHFFRERFGRSADEIIPEAYGDNPKALQLFRNLEKNMKADIMGGTKELLQKIKVKKGIVSTKKMDLIRDFLSEIINEFDIVVSGDDTEKHKPDPEPLLLACKKLKVRPEDAVYVGDAVADYETARNAGVKFIGFIGGGATEEEFKEAGVEVVVHSIKELENVLVDWF